MLTINTDELTPLKIKSELSDNKTWDLIKKTFQFVDKTF